MPICTPEQANNKQCRVVPPIVMQRTSGEGVLVAEGQQSKTEFKMNFPNCMANQCMSWVWHGGGKGYCGRGEPGVQFEESAPPPLAIGESMIDRRKG